MEADDRSSEDRICDSQGKHEYFEIQNEDIQESNEGRMGSIQTFFTLLKGFLVISILFMPNGYSNGGWMFATAALVGSMLITLTCGLLLIQVASKYKGTFSDLGFLAMGNKGRYICDFVLAVSQTGFVTPYVVFISQNLNKIIDYHFGFTVNTWIMGLILFFIDTPLCWVRKIQTLERYHFLGDLTVFSAGIILISEAISFRNDQGSFAEDIEPFNSDKYLVFLGTAIFIFEGVGIILPVREACKNKHHFPAIFTCVILFLCCFFASFGFFNYAVYGEELLSNAPLVTKVLREGNLVVEVVMILFIINVVLSYPLIIYPCNIIIESYSVDKMAPSKTRTFLRNLSRALVVVVTFSIGISLEDTLDRLLSVEGSLTCTPVAFIMPAVFHLQLVAESRLAKALDYFIIGLGFVFLFGLTSYTIISWS
ncbi:unnamed protein product [Moneuplotes crassus]|uniref:Amino acid transporter transmembrane domain-containing protein n=1 Tax=Euplotes crassus TaxID=5936 RepID=A0AAD1XDD1_EUPCR|nr:unnamed protein product [Moneuplotes crassus]